MKQCTLSLAAAMLFGATQVHADMRISENGLGDAVYVPYLTVDDGHDSLISVSNHAATPSYARVIISEANNGQSTLYFDVFLPPDSTWTAAVSSGSDGAVLNSNSSVCTVPAIPAQGVALRNFNYADTYADGGSSGLARTRNGAVEVIERGGLSGDLANLTIAKACADLVQAYLNFDSNPRAGQVVAPSGDIEATVQVVSVTEGRIFSVPGVALQGFVGQPRTELKIAEPVDRFFTPIPESGAVDFVTQSERGRLRFDVARGADAVSSLFMSESTRGEVYTAPGLGAATSWILSFPTKAAYVSAQPGTLAQNGMAAPPFADFFDAEGACETVVRTDKRADGTVKAGGPVETELCAQVNRLDFGPDDEGVSLMNFGGSGTRAISATLIGDTDEPVVLHGLPVVGVRLTSFINAQVVPGVLANYTYAERLRARSGAVEPAD
ncbi:MAG: hypothetical protein KDJ14_09600 [Xanthomonadales bacterium]|nr:hypothetical protein [Xanthomonadales bacterium]